MDGNNYGNTQYPGYNDGSSIGGDGNGVESMYASGQQYLQQGMTGSSWPSQSSGSMYDGAYGSGMMSAGHSASSYAADSNGPSYGQQTYQQDGDYYSHSHAQQLQQQQQQQQSDLDYAGYSSYQQQQPHAYNQRQSYGGSGQSAYDDHQRQILERRKQQQQQQYGGYAAAQQPQPQQPLRSASTSSNPNRMQIPGAGMEWYEAKDGNGRKYWYNTTDSTTHWYNPRAVAHGLRLLQAKQALPPELITHLKLYKIERQQQMVNTQMAQQTQQQQQQQQQLQKQQLLEAKRRQQAQALEEAKRKKEEAELARIAAEKARIERERQAAEEKARLEALRRKEEEERAEAERRRKILEAQERKRYEAARIAERPKTKILLRKYLDTIGYDDTWISADMIDEAVRDAKPAEKDDPERAAFEEAVEETRKYYAAKNRVQEEAAELAELERMQAEDVDASGLSEERKKMGEAEKRKKQLQKDFEEFFKFKPYKMVGKSDWRTTEKVDDDSRIAAEQERRRKLEKTRTAMAVAKSSRRPRRQVKSRLVNVAGHMVLRENNYGMDEDGKPVVEGLLNENNRKQVRPARSAFNIYTSVTGKEVRETFPSLDFRDVQKEVSRRWRLLAPGQKKIFETQSAEDKERYKRELEAARELDLRNMEYNHQLMQEAQKKEQLMHQARQETLALEDSVRRDKAMAASSSTSALSGVAWTGSGAPGNGHGAASPSPPAAAAQRGQPPRMNYPEVADAVMIALGPRAGLEMKELAAWVQNTRLGRIFMGRLKAPFDESPLTKAVRRGINRGRYVQERATGKTPAGGVKFSTSGLLEVARAKSLRDIKEEERQARAKSKNTSASALRAKRQQELEQQRNEHRIAMKADIFEANQRMWAFMYRQKDSLGPFVTKDVKEKLEFAAMLLREHGRGDLLENDPSGYEQEDRIMEEEQRRQKLEAAAAANGETKEAKEATESKDANHSIDEIVPSNSGPSVGDLSGAGTGTGTGTAHENGQTSIAEADKLKQVAQTLTVRRKRPACDQPRDIVWGKLRQYQREGLRWMVSTFQNGINGILADEMGLGKTLQTVSFLTHLKFEMKVGGPFLVIVPLSVLTAWANEFNRWSPKLKVIKLHSSSKEERDRLKRDILSDFSKFDVVITTFEMIISNNMKLMLGSKMWWRYVVIDEGHKIKNDETDLAVAVRSINCQGRLLLTGTPLQNNLHELWALLNYLYPAIFTESSTFDDCFDLSKQIVETDMLAKAHYLIRPFVLRRTKGEVEQKMPPKEEIEVKVPLSKMQRYWYKQLLMRDANLLKRVEGEISGEGSEAGAASAGDWKKLQSLMMQLRKCCNHPYLFPNAEPNFTGETREDLVEASGKLKILDRLLKKLYERGHRVVIFSQFTATLNILQDFCNLRGYKFSRLDGSTNRVQRAIDIMQYNREGSVYFAYLMSTRAGGLGINLATADTVILYDSDWNPQVDLQAMDRVHRIGQTKPVHVYRLIASGTVEERVVQRAKKKLYLDRMVNRGSTSQAEALESLSKAEMLKMLTFGASTVFGGSGGEDDNISDEDLDQMMDRSRLEGKAEGEVDTSTKVLGKSGLSASGEDDEDAEEAAGEGAAARGVVDASLNALEFDGTSEALNLRQLDGVSYEKKSGSDGFPPKPRKRKLAAIAEAANEESVAQSMDEIAKRWAEENPDMYAHGVKPTKRARVSRFVEVDGHTILKANNYTIEQGGRSVYEDELTNGNAAAVLPAQGRQVAGRDYDNEGHCLACWDGGELLLCDQCCAAYHQTCLRPDQLPPRRKDGGQGAVTWGCPHHSCKVCARKAHASGGMLFRCTECPSAFCEDHLPADHLYLNENGREERFEALGQRKPAQAYFVQCSLRCHRFATIRRKDGVLAAIRDIQKNPAGAVEGSKAIKTDASAVEKKEPTMPEPLAATASSTPAVAETKNEDVAMSDFAVSVSTQPIVKDEDVAMKDEDVVTKDEGAIAQNADPDVKIADGDLKVDGAIAQNADPVVKTADAFVTENVVDASATTNESPIHVETKGEDSTMQDAAVSESTAQVKAEDTVMGEDRVANATPSVTPKRESGVGEAAQAEVEAKDDLQAQVKDGGTEMEDVVAKTTFSTSPKLDSGVDEAAQSRVEAKEAPEDASQAQDKEGATVVKDDVAVATPSVTPKLDSGLGGAAPTGVESKIVSKDEEVTNCKEDAVTATSTETSEINAVPEPKSDADAPTQSEGVSVEGAAAVATFTTPTTAENVESSMDSNQANVINEDVTMNDSGVLTSDAADTKVVEENEAGDAVVAKAVLVDDALTQTSAGENKPDATKVKTVPTSLVIEANADEVKAETKEGGEKVAMASSTSDANVPVEARSTTSENDTKVENASSANSKVVPPKETTQDEDIAMADVNSSSKPTSEKTAVTENMGTMATAGEGKIDVAEEIPTLPETSDRAEDEAVAASNADVAATARQSSEVAIESAQVTKEKADDPVDKMQSSQSAVEEVVKSAGSSSTENADATIKVAAPAASDDQGVNANEVKKQEASVSSSEEVSGAAESSVPPANVISAEGSKNTLETMAEDDEPKRKRMKTEEDGADVVRSPSAAANAHSGESQALDGSENSRMSTSTAGQDREAPDEPKEDSATPAGTLAGTPAVTPAGTPAAKVIGQENRDSDASQPHDEHSGPGDSETKD